MRYFVFSYEIGARELLPRFALALFLAREGVTSIIGHKFAIKRVLESGSSKLTGVFTHKDGNSDATKYYRAAANRGLRCVATDEEYLNWCSLSDYGNLVNTVNRGLIDVFFCSTKFTANLVTDLGFSAVHTGNLRLGLCELLSKVSSDGNGSSPARTKVLLNSPTGYLFSINPLITHLEIASRHSVVSKRWSDTVDLLCELTTDEWRIIREMRTFCSSASRACEVTLRSHPAESEYFLKNIAAENSALHDAAKGSSVIAAARSDVVLAYDCTTLLEALFLRKPFLNLAKREIPRGSDVTYAARYLRFSDGKEALEQEGKVPCVPWDRFDDVRSNFGAPGFFSNWYAAFNSLVTAHTGTVLDLDRVRDDPIEMHPDIARRCGSIVASDVNFLVDISKAILPISNVSIRLRKDGVISVGPP